MKEFKTTRELEKQLGINEEICTWNQYQGDKWNNFNEEEYNAAYLEARRLEELAMYSGDYEDFKWSNQYEHSNWAEYKRFNAHYSNWVEDRNMEMAYEV